MKGFHIRRQGAAIEKVTRNSWELNLLAKGDGTEIMLHKIEAGKTFYIYPSDNIETMEFVYLLEGTFICENEGHNATINTHDYYYLQGLSEPIYFKALTNVTFLWFISEPTFHNLSNSMNESLKIVDKVEQKDNYTLKHSERVQEYSIKIARKLKLSKEKLVNLLIASVLHDVGKINTSEEILNKPGNLSNEEYDIIKQHPIDGAMIVENTYYKECSKIIAQHHERLDGSGYPKGLKDDDISVEAKIIAVSDSFDAMTEDRVYRKAMLPTDAIEQIRNLIGKKYDGKIVHAFIEVLKEEGKI